MASKIFTIPQQRSSFYLPITQKFNVKIIRKALWHYRSSVSNGHWLNLSSDPIFTRCFNIYLFGCYLSVVEVTSRSGQDVKEFLWTTFIWIFLDSHRKPQQIDIQTRVSTANDLLKITMVCHHMVFNQISNLVSFTVHMSIE